METFLECSGNRVQRKRRAQKASTGRDRGVAGSCRWVGAFLHGCTHGCPRLKEKLAKS